MSKDENLKLNSMNGMVFYLRMCVPMSGRRDRMKYGGNSCDGLEVTTDDLHGHSDSKHSS